MQKFILTGFIAVSALALLTLGLPSPLSLELQLIPSAHAVVGRPLSPVSVGGVARRSTRRAVYATNANQQAQQQAQQQQAQQATSTLPKGTVVPALPAGCDSVTVDGTNLFNCGGVMYQPKFQSNNLVYVVI